MYKIIFRFKGGRYITCCTFSKIQFDGERLEFIADNPEHNVSYFADMETALDMVDGFTSSGYATLYVIPEESKCVSGADIPNFYKKET